MREWIDFTELPIRAEFEQQFNLRHDIYTCSKKITLYLHLDTKLKLNKQKHKVEVYLYLMQDNIFLEPDIFSTKKTASPGCLIKIHSTLARKEQAWCQWKALVQDVIVETEEMTLMQYLLSGNFGIKSIEETNHAEECEKWFISYQKKSANKVHHFVDNMLEQSFDNCI
eukprot:180844-Ditylum_brightwellii.AAC.2